MQLTSDLFRFLEELKANNDRIWFKSNQVRFEQTVREPLLAFIAAFEEPLANISPSMLASAKKSGGSMFRIHRDTRFSKDKSPYKTWAAVQFRHEAGRDAHAPCYYLHLAPGDVFVGAGIWHPDRAALDAIRVLIDEKPAKWVKARDAVLLAGWDLEGDALKRIPRGYAAEHPLADDLRRKDFIAVRRLSEQDVVQSGFLQRYTDLCREPVNLMKFLTEALGLPF
ncbi:MAG: TIGR02453 family protein [Gemmatimonadota bacterium]